MDRINSNNFKKYNRSQIKHDHIRHDEQAHNQTNQPNQPNKKRRRKRKFTKRKAIVLLCLILILALILIGVFFFINKFIPVKDVDSSNIEINLSTTKPTGKAISALVTTKTHYDIYYFIDYVAAQEKYYASTEGGEAPETTPDTKKAQQINVKDIKDDEYKKLENSRFEITDNGVVYLKYGRFGKLSSTPYVFEITNIDKTGPEIGEITTTSTYTTITVTVNATDNSGGELQYAFRLANSSNYVSTGTKNSYTFTDLTTDESYSIFVKAIDSYGNESEAVTEAKASVEQEILAEKKLYHFRVNYSANTVTVYDVDGNGNYTNPIKAFICSTGRSTPKSGTYKITDRYRWRNLIGGVNGQYAVRIVGNILFHSVPYYKMYPNTLEYEEYDKLGTSASLGCVRLCVRDAKWIYDNAKTGSTVEFYSDPDDPGPLGKPTAQKISDNAAFRDWDPTDPDTHNPWLGGDGGVSKPQIIEEEIGTSTIIRNNNNSSKNTSTVIRNTSTSTNTTSNTTTNTSVDPEPETNTVVDPDPTPEPTTNTTVDPEPELNTNTTVDPDPTPEPTTNTTVDPEPGPNTNTTVDPDPTPEPSTDTNTTSTDTGN